MVGGTSIGSFMGGVWAASRDLQTLRDKMILLSTDMSSYVPKLFDLTYPVTSMFSGHSFNRAIHQIFEDIQIEVSRLVDCCVIFFCISFNRAIHQIFEDIQIEVSRLLCCVFLYFV